MTFGVLADQIPARSLGSRRFGIRIGSEEAATTPAARRRVRPSSRGSGTDAPTALAVGRAGERHSVPVRQDELACREIIAVRQCVPQHDAAVADRRAAGRWAASDRAGRRLSGDGVPHRVRAPGSEASPRRASRRCWRRAPRGAQRAKVIGSADALASGAPHR